jgi:lipoyl(octanoyl) transferase
MNNTVLIRRLGSEDYLSTWKNMQEFTDSRTEQTPDEIWVLQHPPVFTQGQNGKPEHLLDPGSIPVINVDRGGQVTYHGPGQLIAYTLVDIQRKHFNVREIVTRLEKAIIQLLLSYEIPAETQCKAPGVYIDNKKIASIGLRIRRGSAFHGLALNACMDLEPFSRINPCGFAGLEMAQVSHWHPDLDLSSLESKLVESLVANLGYTTHLIVAEKWYGTKNDK